MTKILLVVAFIAASSISTFGQALDPMVNISVELTRVRSAVTALSKSMIDFVDKFEKVGGVTINEKQQKLIVAMEVLQRAEARLAGLQQAQVLQVEKLNETKAKLAQVGLDVATSTPAEFAKFVRAESDKWAKVIKAANIRGDAP